MDREEAKRLAGVAAADEVRDGMVVGLGTGSTVRHTIEELGRRVKAGLQMTGIPTSRASEALARSLGIPLLGLDEHPVVDVTIDGADELDGKLRLVKGGGGALTREKIVARASRRMVVVADQAKVVETLGAFPLPLEVLEFAKAPVQRFVAGLGAACSVRRAGDAPARTDNGNILVDAAFRRIEDPARLERELELFPGIVCSGLFVGLCHAAYVAGPDGVKVMGAHGKR